MHFLSAALWSGTLFIFGDFNMINLTFITAELSAKTVYFFQCCGADMGISSSAVLNRLMLKIHEDTTVRAAKLTMWYFDALAARKSKEEKLEILHIFAALCLALFDDDTVLKNLQTYSEEDTIENISVPVDFTFSRRIRVVLTNEAAGILKDKMSEYKLSEGGAIDKIVNDFTSRDTIIIPYTLIKYLFISAGHLINSHAHMAVCLTLSYCIDRICELSDFSMKNVTNKIKHMRDLAYTDKDISDNINFIKESKFYKEKFT